MNKGLDWQSSTHFFSIGWNRDSKYERKFNPCSSPGVWIRVSYLNRFGGLITPLSYPIRKLTRESFLLLHRHSNKSWPRWQLIPSFFSAKGRISFHWNEGIFRVPTFDTFANIFLLIISISNKRKKENELWDLKVTEDFIESGKSILCKWVLRMV